MTDGSSTVFGKVIDGWNVLSSIENVELQDSDHFRPLNVNDITIEN